MLGYPTVSLVHGYKFVMDSLFYEHMQKVADELAASSKSSVISEEKFEAITHHLLHPDVKVDPHFKHWVKKRGFQIVDLPAFGLHQVLVLPKERKDVTVSLIMHYSHNYKSCFSVENLQLMSTIKNTIKIYSAT